MRHRLNHLQDDFVSRRAHQQFSTEGSTLGSCPPTKTRIQTAHGAVGPLIMVLLGIVLLPTFPIWIGLMLPLFPVFLVVGLIVGLIKMLHR